MFTKLENKGKLQEEGRQNESELNNEIMFNYAFIDRGVLCTLNIQLLHLDST